VVEAGRRRLRSKRPAASRKGRDAEDGGRPPSLTGPVRPAVLPHHERGRRGQVPGEPKPDDRFPSGAGGRLRPGLREGGRLREAQAQESSHSVALSTAVRAECMRGSCPPVRSGDTGFAEVGLGKDKRCQEPFLTSPPVVFRRPRAPSSDKKVPDTFFFPCRASASPRSLGMADPAGA
jgi:hypothetical protein